MEVYLLSTPLGSELCRASTAACTSTAKSAAVGVVKLKTPSPLLQRRPHSKENTSDVFVYVRMYLETHDHGTITAVQESTRQRNYIYGSSFLADKLIGQEQDAGK